MTSTSGAALILPRGLLRRPDFVTACAARDFAAVFAMVRKYAGISQVRVAAALDMTPSRVGEVINAVSPGSPDASTGSQGLVHRVRARTGHLRRMDLTGHDGK
jgi:hypothetical protein